jgi:hypothetical protein
MIILEKTELETTLTTLNIEDVTDFIQEHTERNRDKEVRFSVILSSTPDSKSVWKVEVDEM